MQQNRALEKIFMDRLEKKYPIGSGIENAKKRHSAIIKFYTDRMEATLLKDFDMEMEDGIDR